jgi:hypothetical protein
MVGGEGQPGNEPPFSIIEAFKPPYLFRGVRPEIVNFTQNVFQRGSQIVFDVIKTDSVTQVILMSTTSVTHMMNCGNNRYAELPFTQTGNTITANIPLDSLNVLDGYYQLFAMVDDIPSISNIIKVENSVTTSVNNSNVEQNNIFIYPNPAQNNFTVQLSSSTTFDLTITDVLGKNILRQNNILSNTQINCKDFSTGIYFLQITNGKNIFNKKLIITK